MARIITLTTDFGAGSPYVAAMKGVILSINPRRRSSTSRTRICAAGRSPGGAGAGRRRHAGFPPDTIHVAVVDPGVGTARQIVYARIGAHHFVAPDNGLLSRLALATRPSTIIAVERPEFWLPAVSATFHGRDIMAPVAARLSLGLDPSRLGPAARELDSSSGRRLA